MALLNKKSFSIVFLVIPFLLSFACIAQKIDTVATYSITAYIDAYYAHYSDSVGLANFQKFPDASPRSNSPSLNITSVNMQYNGDKVRGVFALNYGDIASAVFPHPYNNVLEAHLGFKIYSKLWIDAGFFRPHFGTEFILPVENITSSVAVATAYEASYESGIRLNFDPTKKLEINLFLLNGFGMYVDNSNKKAFGMGVTYAFNDNCNIGYTNYIGPPNNASDNNLRIHQNLFINYQVKKIKLQVGGDYCIQQNADLVTESKTATMYTALATVKYQSTKKFGIYARAEIFEDPDGFMSAIVRDSASGYISGYKLWGITGGLEIKPTEESYVRLESRYIQMDENQYIFNDIGNMTNGRWEIMVNAGVTFDLLKGVRTNKKD